MFICREFGLGRAVSEFDIPVCDKFIPVILEDQLCYQVDVNQFKNLIDMKKLISHGLVFLMDYNSDRMEPEARNEMDSDDFENILDEEEDMDYSNEAMIYIETLGY